MPMRDGLHMRNDTIFEQCVIFDHIQGAGRFFSVQLYRFCRELLSQWVDKIIAQYEDVG